MENQNSAKKIEKKDQLVLSYELLQLMEWIVDHEAEALKKIIIRSLKKGFDEQLRQTQNIKDLYSTEDMQNSVIDFLSLFEILLMEVTNEKEIDDIVQKNLLPAIDHVDINNCDNSAVQTSIAVATSKLQRNPKENAQEIFLRELLKRWKPTKDVLN